MNLTIDHWTEGRPCRIDGKIRLIKFELGQDRYGRSFATPVSDTGLNLLGIPPKMVVTDKRKYADEGGKFLDIARQLNIEVIR